MSYNFKSIADTQVVAEPSESVHVLIEENGEIKRAPKTAVGGAGGKYDLVIVFDRAHNEDPYIESGSYQNVYNRIMVEQEEPRIMVKFCTSYYNYAYSIRTHFEQAELIIDLHDPDVQYLYIPLNSRESGDSLCVYPDGTIYR